jgi:hypothetical protein
MRLICELCAERDLAAIINIHDVALAQMFVSGRRPRRASSPSTVRRSK